MAPASSGLCPRALFRVLLLFFESSIRSGLAIPDNRLAYRLFELSETLYQTYHLVRPASPSENDRLRILYTTFHTGDSGGANSGALCSAQVLYVPFLNAKQYHEGWTQIYRTGALYAQWNPHRSCFLRSWDNCLQNLQACPNAEKATLTNYLDVFGNGVVDPDFAVGDYPSWRSVGSSLQSQ